MSFNQALANLPQNDFEFLLKNAKRSHVLNNVDFESLCFSSYKFVKEIAPELIREGNFERLIYECFFDRKISIFVNDVNNFDFNECLYFVFWLIDDLKYWAEMETTHLSGEPDFDMLSAGINELNIFGDLNMIDGMAVKYGKSHNEIRGWSYQMLFDLQLKSIKEAAFQKEYARRMNEKSKSKSK